MDNNRRGKRVTVEMLDNECVITDKLDKNICITIPIKSIIIDN